jgi:CHASE3 domain sensor protein
MSLQTGKQFYKLVVVAWLTFSLGSVVLALVSWHQLSAQRVVGTRIVASRDDLNGILKSLLDMETGERGYVITGNKNFLEPFIQGETNLPAQFDDLVNLVHDDPAMLESVTKLRAAAQASLSWQLSVINARTRSFDQAAGMVATGNLKRMMDEMRAQIDLLDRTYSDRMTFIRQDIGKRLTRANLTSLVAGIFGIGAGLLAL